MYQREVQKFWLIGRNSDLDNVTDDGDPNEFLQLSDANPYDGPEPD